MSKKTAPAQNVTTWPATSLVISSMIGVGIFTSLGFQIDGFGVEALQQHVFALIMLWIVGGLLALCGALCYTELATALPRSGGEYNFLSYIYHPSIGFCAGLSSATVGFSAPVAISALAFGKYLVSAFPAQLKPIPHSDLILAFVLVIVLTLAHLRSIRFSGKLQGGTTLLTILLILAFIVTGLFFTPHEAVTFVPRSFDFSLLMTSAFATSLLWVMYAYSGWNAAAYVVGEVKEPARTLPRALLLGTAGVMLLYVAINIVFLLTTPLKAMSGEFNVATTCGEKIFGQTGAQVVSFLICIGLVANTSAFIWLGSRVMEAMGENYRALRFLGLTTTTRVPYVALLVQLAIILVLLNYDPNTILTYVEAVLFFWCLLTVVGLIVLRLTEPDLPRPYRAWGYPVTPIIFACVATFSLIFSFERNFYQSTAGVATVLIGIPIYYAVRNKK